ncbi:hypothetical protein [Plantactinospora sp. B24E8]|uniref:hypothetical protein n=1 Tax=Plantactinospora sp. B24E8 TaxID=3153567 RepID=UPI00325C4E05
MQSPQLRTGTDAELRHQHLPHRLVRLQRLGLPAGPVQRHHQPAPQRLPQRLPGGQVPQLRQQVTVPAGVEQQVEPAFGGRVPLLGQSRRVLGDEPLGADVLQRFATPAAERAVKKVQFGAGVGGPGRADQGPEPVHVDRLRWRGQPVSAGHPGDHVRSEVVAQPGDDGGDRPTGQRRNLLTPEVPGQRPGAHRPSGG